MLKIENLYKSYLPKGQISISGCGTSLVEKHVDNSEFDQQFAVNNICISLKKNEILAILGENGSGKSTLLKLLAGLLEPDYGTITLNHKIVSGPSSKLVAGHENIKLIHQNYNLFPNISLADNILYAMRFFTEDYQQKKLEELLSVCSLTEISHKLPREVSGGEQQRTAIAAALATNIDLLLLDEPFSNLDIFNKSELRKYILKISKRYGLSVVFVTHDAHDALSIADYTSVIKNGIILQTTSPENIYQKPINEYVAGITGGINVFTNRQLSSFLKINLLAKSGTKFGVRPEKVSLNVNEKMLSSKAIVKELYYHGSQYELVLEIDSKYKLKTVSEYPFEKGSEISFGFYQQNLIKLSD
jgi:iron(III) transport system ATP-binding protein